MAISLWKCIEKKRVDRKKLCQLSSYANFKLAIQTPNYQNTYRLESLNSLKIDSIDEIVKTTMSNRLEDFIYDETTAPALCTQVAQEIKKKIIKLDFDRYKLLVIVTMIEKASQSLEINAGFLWDIERDNYSTYTYDNNQTFTAYCLIIATYFE